MCLTSNPSLTHSHCSLQTLAITASSLFTAAVHYGYGQDMGKLLSENSVLAVKYYVITQACIIGSTAAARVAFIIYLLAILGGEKKHGIILSALAALEVVFNAVSIILIFTGCKNVRAIWNTAINSECASPNIQIRYGYFQSGMPSPPFSIKYGSPPLVFSSLYTPPCILYCFITKFG